MKEQLQRGERPVHGRTGYGASVARIPPGFADPRELEVFDHALGNFIEPIPSEKANQGIKIGSVKLTRFGPMLLLGPSEKFLYEFFELGCQLGLGKTRSPIEQISLALCLGAERRSFVCETGRFAEAPSLEFKLVPPDFFTSVDRHG